MPPTIGILAGGGRLPTLIAESVVARGGQVHIVGVIGEADDSITRFPHTWANWGQVGLMLETLRTKGGGVMVIAGGVTRPNLFKLRPDLGFFRVLPQVLRMLRGGDDSVLTRVVRVFEHYGLTVKGAHEVAPDLLAGSGTLGAVSLSPTGDKDAVVAFAVRQLLGPLDAGQAVVVREGSVLAIEGAEGTDRMLARLVADARSQEASAPAGILAKGPKPGQELRVDMPVIGTRTIDGLQAAGLAGVVLEAGRALLIDRDETVRKADAVGLAIVAHRAEAMQGAAADLLARALRRAAPHKGHCAGRVQPSGQDTADIEKGLVAVTRLAGLNTGRSVVITRAYVLAVEAREGLEAMLERVGQLRQWGLGRRVGALVLTAAVADGLTPRVILEKAAAQGLAGVAVAGKAAVLQAWSEAGPIADALGLFLVVCESRTCGEGS